MGEDMTVPRKLLVMWGLDDPNKLVEVFKGDDFKSIDVVIELTGVEPLVLLRTVVEKTTSFHAYRLALKRALRMNSKDLGPRGLVTMGEMTGAYGTPEMMGVLYQMLKDSLHSADLQKVLMSAGMAAIQANRGDNLLQLYQETQTLRLPVDEFYPVALEKQNLTISALVSVWMKACGIQPNKEIFGSAFVGGDALIVRHFLECWTHLTIGDMLDEAKVMMASNPSVDFSAAKAEFCRYANDENIFDVRHETADA